MNRKGFTLVEIMIVVAIIALLAAIAIPNLMRARMAANEALAQSTLRTMSTAAETFASANNGVYPSDEEALTAPASGPPYYNKAYCTSTHSGYTYDCDGFAIGGYTIVAEPLAGTDMREFTITTGGVLTPQE